MENKKLEVVLKETIATNDSLIEALQPISNFNADSHSCMDAVIYKLLSSNLSILSRLERIYKASEQLVEQGRIQANINVAFGLFSDFVKKTQQQNGTGFE